MSKPIEERSTSDILRAGAGHLRLSAAVLERTLTVKGEAADPRIAEMIRQQRETAAAMLKRAAEIQPHPVLKKWECGQKAAMKHLKQITPGRPS